MESIKTETLIDQINKVKEFHTAFGITNREIPSADLSDKEILLRFNLMKEDLVKPLFESRLSWLSICLDGYSQEVYEKYRVLGNVNIVKDGIQI